ncbi:MAG: NAD-dependent epimerase/dehydratase family protein [Candidatus Doudnabacteria bacterium]|nr:NAD-dependent epimerase/dehydratase family protein [Candidatus Doudnabacteria bacterium]
MKKQTILMLGANGQVASELLVLIKKQRPEVEVRGVCRNFAGSLYLRYHHIPVIHAAIEDNQFPVALLREADLVINAIYVRGRPAEIKRRHATILRNIISHLGPRTKFVHLSSIAVFHTSAYADEKLSQEKLVKRFAKQYGKKTIILRLGHVLGHNQSNSAKFLEWLEKKDRKLSLPKAGEYEANCVSIRYLSAVCLDLLARVMKNDQVYTTVFNPAVTWSEIFQALGAVDIEQLESSVRTTPANKFFRAIRNHAGIKDFFMRILRQVPSVEDKIYVRHLLDGANQEILALGDRDHIELKFPYVLWESAPGERYPLLHTFSPKEIMPI